MTEDKCAKSCTSHLSYEQLLRKERASAALKALTVDSVDLAEGRSFMRGRRRLPGSVGEKSGSCTSTSVGPLIIRWGCRQRPMDDSRIICTSPLQRLGGIDISCCSLSGAELTSRITVESHYQGQVGPGTSARLLEFSSRMCQLRVLLQVVAAGRDLGCGWLQLN